MATAIPISLLVISGLLVAKAQAASGLLQQAEPAASKIADVPYPISVSPDGQLISVFGTGGNLAILDLDTKETRDLTSARFPQLVMSTVFSPCGEQIAYAWHNEQDFDDLRVIDTDGSEPTVLYRDAAVRSIWVKDWSPDRQFILVVLLKYDSTAQIALVPASGGPPRVISLLNTRAGGVPGTMVFSPDGRSIAYDAGVGSARSSHDIFFIPTNGSTAPAALVHHAADDRLLGWSPDGTAIAFASDRGGTVNIWMLRLSDGAAEGTPRLIRRDVGQMAPLGLTDDGSYYFGVSTCVCHLYVADLDPVTGVLQDGLQIVGPALHNTGADWSPDGRYLAYVTPAGGVLPPIMGVSRGSWALALRSVETGEERSLSVEIDILHQLRPLWSPDGRLILAKGWDPKAYPREVAYGIAVETGEVSTLLVSESLWDWMFDWVEWSADGTALFYTDEAADSTTGILMRELASDQEQDLFRDVAPPFFYGLTASPDGQHLAFGIWDVKERQSRLAVMSLARNERRVLLELALPAHVAPPAWYPDSRHLMYEAEGQLWRISVDGGQPESLGTYAPLRYNQAGLSIHPDGRRIAFVAEEERRSEVWMIDSLLPRQ